MTTTTDLSPAVATIIANYAEWTRTASTTYASTLEQANDFIVEHGFQQISDFVVDAVAAFKAELTAKATEIDPDADPDLIYQQIEQWSRINVSEAGQDAALLAAIYGKGSYDLEFAIEDATPGATY